MDTVQCTVYCTGCILYKVWTQYRVNGKNDRVAKEYEGDLEGVMRNLATVSRAQAVVNSGDSDIIVKRKEINQLINRFNIT